MNYERLFSSNVQLFLLNIAIAAIIYFQAELGKMLGIKGIPLPISIVWPSTGFALASLLLFGTKTWPGVFFGNYIYNLLQFPFSQPVFYFALAITLGSLIQALVANWVIRKFSSRTYFNNLNDVLIFLFPGGILACLIACTIGITTLYLYAGTSMKYNFYVWLTFWIGDTMGVYIFTPLLVIWALHKWNPNYYAKRYFLTLILALFVAISYLAVHFDVSFALFFIPLSLFVTYHFGMHGATLITFAMTLALLVPYSKFGYPTSPTSLVKNPLLFLVLLLEINVITTLIFAAILKERRIYKS